MAGQAAAEAATLALAQSLDQGSRLSVQDYQHLLRRAAKPAEQQQLNAGAAANAPRLVVPQRGSATTPGLIERTLIQPGRKGVAVALSKAMQASSWPGRLVCTGATVGWRAASLGAADAVGGPLWPAALQVDIGSSPVGTPCRRTRTAASAPCHAA